MSPSHFMHANAACSSVDLQLSGAIPPLTAQRTDVALKAGIVVSERRAAEELIARQRQESLAAKQRLVTEARSRPASQGTPRLGKAFEETLAEYYRRLEEVQDLEFAATQQALREEAEQLQREHVRREHFEMQHRRREFAIVHELHRRERRRVFDDSRAVLVMDRLADEQRKWRQEQWLKKESAREKREENTARRVKYESHFDFILSQEAVDRACHKADMRKHWQAQQAATKEKVERRKEKWERHSRQLRARRLFQQEQRKVCKHERQRQHAYHALKQKAQEEKELEERRANVHLAHVVKGIMRGMREKGQKDRRDRCRDDVTRPAVSKTDPQESEPESTSHPQGLPLVNQEVCAVLGLDPDATVPDRLPVTR